MQQASPPHYQDASVTLHHGDCLDVLRELPDNSVDSVVTDPPYSLGFMGREWDTHRTATAFQDWCYLWAAECLRVLRPGGHLLAFGGTRTWHRLACAVEDAGFEMRDSIAWLYGSGFPKSLDVSKAIDRKRDDLADVVAVTSRLADLAEAAGVTRASLDERMGTSDMGGWWLSRLAHRCACPSVENWTRLRDLIPGAPELDAEVWRLNGRKGTPGKAWEQREVTGSQRRAATGRMAQGEGGYAFGEDFNITAPATEAAQQWAGFGTALKPAFEPIVVARKPLVGTVAANVLAFGTGALNIDGCRIGTEERTYTSSAQPGGNAVRVRDGGDGRDAENARAYGNQSRLRPATTVSGRWPPNVIIDADAAAELDQQNDASRFFYIAQGDEPCGFGQSASTVGNESNMQAAAGGLCNAQNAPVRFRYAAKAPKRERPTVDGIAHPTVKPLSLMRWLVRLVTPPDGVVLDPFAGSGATVEAALLEGFRVVGIEREADYLPLIEARIQRANMAASQVAPLAELSLFD